MASVLIFGAYSYSIEHNNLSLLWHSINLALEAAINSSKKKLEIYPGAGLFQQIDGLNLYPGGPSASFKIGAAGNAPNSRNITVKFFNTVILDQSMSSFSYLKKQVNNIASKTKPKDTQQSTPKHKQQNKKRGKQTGDKGKKTSNKPNKPGSNKSNKSSSNKSNRSNSNKSDSSRHGSNKPKHNKTHSRSDSKNWRSTREEKGPDHGKQPQPKRRPSIGFHKKPQHF